MGRSFINMYVVMFIKKILRIKTTIISVKQNFPDSDNY